MKLALGTLTIGLSLSAVFPAVAKPCKAYVVGRDMGSEVNNCPMMSGKFSNSSWQVEVSQWEPGMYVYRSKNLSNGNSIELWDFDVRGTTSRPEYRFKNKKVLHIVTFQKSDSSTIRLEIYQGNKKILNQLLSR